jgi:hypothetical protein
MYWRDHVEILKEIEQIRIEPQTGAAFNAQHNKLLSDQISVQIDLIETLKVLDRRNLRIQWVLIALSIIGAILIVLQMVLALPTTRICTQTSKDEGVTENCVTDIKMGLFGEHRILSQNTTYKVCSTNMSLQGPLHPISLSYFITSPTTVNAFTLGSLSTSSDPCRLGF